MPYECSLGVAEQYLIVHCFYVISIFITIPFRYSSLYRAILDEVPFPYWF